MLDWVYSLSLAWLVVVVFAATLAVGAAIWIGVSALRTADLLVEAFPRPDAERMRLLVRRHISNTVEREWPEMARRRATLMFVPPALAGALHLALGLHPRTEGQRVAQRELVVALEDALDARRQRIILSQSRVNWAKWVGVAALAVLALVGIAAVHAARRATSAIALAIFACSIATSIILIMSQDRPFGGPFGIKPDPLEQVAPGLR